MTRTTPLIAIGIAGILMFALATAEPATEDASADAHDISRHRLLTPPGPATEDASEDAAGADPAAASSETQDASQDSPSEDAQELQLLRLYLSNGTDYRGRDYYRRIGELRRWERSVPLSQEQEDAIRKLDDLLWARSIPHEQLLSLLDSVGGDLDEYRKRAERLKVWLHARHERAVEHVRRMVALGLLTEQQSGYVTGRWYAAQRPLDVLSYDERVQEWLAITRDQLAELDQVGAEASADAAHLQLFSYDRFDRDEFAARLETIEERADKAALGILTPRQRATWDRLITPKWPPAGPPDLPALSEDAAGDINLAAHSQWFRNLVVKKDDLDLSDEQKGLIEDLKEVTRLGLFWISQRDGEKPFPPGLNDRGVSAGGHPKDVTREEFLEHAEQVLMLGILTEEQAKALCVFCC